jgi:O-antigen ligase/tetratricopeptide (TPR) repeat protein
MITQLHLLAYFFILTQTLREERQWQVMFTTVLFSGVLMGFSALIQIGALHYIYRFNPTDRFGGASGNANWLASYMVLNVFIALWFLSRNDKDRFYPSIAKTWLLLLIALDAALLLLDVTGSGPSHGILSAGLDIPGVVLFALVLHAASVSWYFLRRKTALGSAFLALLVGYYLLWMYLSGTRAAVVAIAGSLALIAIFYLLGGPRRGLKWMAAGWIFVLCLLPLLVRFSRRSAWVQSRPGLSRYTAIGLAEAGPRLPAWKASWLGILDRPIIGWGLENYKNAFDRHFPPKLYEGPTSELWFDRAHNSILDIGATTGAVGIAAYLALIGTVLGFLIRRWFRTRELSGSLLVAGLLTAYLFQSLFTFDSVNTDGVLYLILGYICYLFTQDRVERVTSDPATVATPPVRSRWAWVTGLATLGLLLPANLLAVKSPYESNRLLNRAISMEKELDGQTGQSRHAFRQETLDLFQRASDFQTTGRHLVREEFANYASALISEPKVPVNEKITVVKRALEFLEESMRQEPLNARHYMYASSLAIMASGAIRKSDPEFAASLAKRSLDHLQAAESLSPTRPPVLIERSRALLALGRISEAIESMRRASELNPLPKGPHLDLVAMYVLSERYSEAKAEWQRMKDLSIRLKSTDYAQVINYWLARRQYSTVRDLYIEQLKTSPADGDLMAHLATTYRAMGDIDKARETALKAASLSPAVAAELPKFLDSLGK